MLISKYFKVSIRSKKLSLRENRSLNMSFKMPPLITIITLSFVTQGYLYGYRSPITIL